MKNKGEKMRAWIIVGVLCAAVITGCQSVQNTETSDEPPVGKGDWEAAIQNLSEFIKEQMNRYKVVGLSIALVDDQETVWSQGFGYADREAGIPATESTIYPIASISKLFTATAVMQLAEQEILDIDTPFADYFPDFKVKSRFPEADPVTVRNILTHHSGLPQIMKLNQTGDFSQVAVPDLEEEYMALPSNLIVSYSNLGYRLLGRMVEHVTGQSFYSYIDDRIFAPLGMNDTSFLPRQDLTAAASKGYSEDLERPLLPFYNPAGSVLSNVTDMSRFMKMVFSGGKTESHQIVRRESLEEMFRCQNSDVALDDPIKEVGLGWHYFKFYDVVPEGAEMLGHTGGLPPFSSFLLTVPDLKLGVVVLTNTNEGGSIIFAAAHRALKLMYQAKTGESVVYDWPEAKPLASAVKLSPEELEEYVGFYDITDDIVEVRLKGNSLTTELAGRKLKLVPLADGTFMLRRLLFGLIPIRLEEMEKTTFSFTEKMGYGILIEHQRNGIESRIGTKLDPSGLITEAWRKRLGAYECLDTGDTPVYTKGLTLKENRGFLFATIETYSVACESSLKWPATFLVLSDTEAIINGVHRGSKGDTLRSVFINGREYLRFYGHTFKKFP